MQASNANADPLKPRLLYTRSSRSAVHVEIYVRFDHKHV